MPASVPPREMAAVTAMPVPAFALAIVPVPVKVTVSAPRTPLKLPVIVTFVFPGAYARLVAAPPVNVRGAAVISAEKLG